MSGRGPHLTKDDMLLKPYYETELGKLYHGDCLEILPHLEPVDLVLTDPNYGIGINKSHRLSVSRGFGDETWDEKPASKERIQLCLSISKNQIIWGGNYFALPRTRGFIIWDKNNYERDFADCEYAWTSFDKVARIYKKRPMNMDGGKVHPTQKPVELMIYCLNDYAEKPNCVTDPFFGSGTTAIACERLGIRWAGIEISEKTCAIAKQRIENERKQRKLFT